MSDRAAVSPVRLKAAWAVAVGVDALQIFLLPATVEGAFSPLADGLDFAAMAVLWALVGWHWVFLPSVIMEVMPIVDLAPTWTIAVAIATRGLSSRGPQGAPAAEPPRPDDPRVLTVESTSRPAPEERKP